MLMSCSAVLPLVRRGALPAEDYARLKVDIASERAAADAEAERLTAHADAMTGTLGNLDAEDETLRRLTALRQAVAGQVTGAEGGVGALRTAIASVFEFVAIWPADCMSGDMPEYPDFSDLRVMPAVRREIVPRRRATSPSRTSASYAACRSRSPRTTINRTPWSGST
jgi:hypothetical protein